MRTAAQRAALPSQDPAPHRAVPGPRHAALSDRAEALAAARPVQRLGALAGVVQRAVVRTPPTTVHNRNPAVSLVSGLDYGITYAEINGKQIPPSSNKQGLIRHPSYSFPEDPMRGAANQYGLTLHVPDQDVSERIELPTVGPWPLGYNSTVGKMDVYLANAGLHAPHRSEEQEDIPATLIVQPDGALENQIALHEQHHVVDIRRAIDEIVVPWDHELTQSKAQADVQTGRDPLSVLNKWHGPDETSQQVADRLVTRLGDDGRAYHMTDEGKAPVITGCAIAKTPQLWTYRVTLKLAKV